MRHERGHRIMQIADDKTCVSCGGNAIEKLAKCETRRLSPLTISYSDDGVKTLVLKLGRNIPVYSLMKIAYRV